MRKYDNDPGRKAPLSERLLDVLWMLIITGASVAVVFFGLLAFLSES